MDLLRMERSTETHCKRRAAGEAQDPSRSQNCKSQLPHVYVVSEQVIHLSSLCFSACKTHVSHTLLSQMRKCFSDGGLQM